MFTAGYPCKVHELACTSDVSMVAHLITMDKVIYWCGIHFSIRCEYCNSEEYSEAGLHWILPPSGWSSLWSTHLSVSCCSTPLHNSAITGEDNSAELWSDKWEWVFESAGCGGGATPTNSAHGENGWNGTATETGWTDDCSTEEITTWYITLNVCTYYLWNNYTNQSRGMHQHMHYALVISRYSGMQLSEAP